MNLKIVVAAASLLAGAASADTFVTSGAVDVNDGKLTPQLVKQQPKGGVCLYAGVPLAVGDTLEVKAVGVTQVCVLGDNGPRMRTVQPDKTTAAFRPALRGT